MRRSFVSLLAIFALASTCWAADKAASPAKKQTAEEEKKLADTRKEIEEKRTELNGSSWSLVTVSSDPKLDGLKDTFTFQNGQVRSDNLAKRGFLSTNYTVSVPSETSEIAVWETMQTGKEGIVFIRGEWAKDKMSGSINEQLEGGKKLREYTFSTSIRKSIPPTSTSDEKSPTEGVTADSKTLKTPVTAMVSKEKK